MKRRSVLKATAVFTLAMVTALPMAAKELRTKLRRVDGSVGKSRRVRINGERAWEVTLPPDGREEEIASEASGRQREELRDYTQTAQGTVRYSIDVLMPPWDDPDGRLEAKVMFFQLKPRKRRGESFWPYLSVEIPPDYRRAGPKVDFQFDLGPTMIKQSRSPMAPNRWYQLQVTVKWSTASDGYAIVELDDRQIARFDGVTVTDNSIPLVNFGTYRSHLNATDPSKLETVQLFFRRYRVERLSS
ncbi:heparin lyase I family protein [Ruegeria atlantica]|uniref:Polysaccharide lyase n=1 Tax=Ruegeria atlantica TaxID=81569 RepID=A0ABX1WE02_9RHOB|nr:heparin lyase I family protein [Ruegeria atlantica]NOD31498.1 hypothetical protein [Ruegeria atlantica]